MSKGRLIIVSGPSGSGKDTVLNEVFKMHPEVRFSISNVTRAMREGEVANGKYHFITREQFEAALENGEILEHNVYLGNYYGTPKKPVDDAIKDGAEIVLEIDINGARTVKKKCPEAVSVFIMPPSFEVLRARLSGRGTESDEQINGRLSIALGEIAAADEYDYIVVNDRLETAVDEMISIILGDRCKTERRENIIKEVLMDAESGNR